MYSHIYDISLNSYCNNKYLRQFEQRIKKQNFCFQLFFSENRAVCVIMWEKYGTAREVTDDIQYGKCALNAG